MDIDQREPCYSAAFEALEAAWGDPAARTPELFMALVTTWGLSRASAERVLALNPAILTEDLRGCFDNLLPPIWAIYQQLRGAGIVAPAGYKLVVEVQESATGKFVDEYTFGDSALDQSGFRGLELGFGKVALVA